MQTDTPTWVRSTSADTIRLISPSVFLISNNLNQISTLQPGEVHQKCNKDGLAPSGSSVLTPTSTFLTFYVFFIIIIISRDSY